jgi:hypothetical protein
MLDVVVSVRASQAPGILRKLKESDPVPIA